jgi:hypothetical protein
MRWTTWKRAIVIVSAALFAIQLVPVSGANPIVEREVPAPLEVRTLLRRACYDCHSNETRWPWYARVAPASWLVARHVQEGRAALNFSQWNALEVARQRSAMTMISHRVGTGKMPPWFYVPLHPEARLSESDRELLRNWARSLARATLTSSRSDEQTHTIKNP